MAVEFTNAEVGCGPDSMAEKLALRDRVELDCDMQVQLLKMNRRKVQNYLLALEIADILSSETVQPSVRVSESEMSQERLGGMF